MKRKITLVLAICFIGFLNVVHAQVNKQDSLALVALYNSTDGPHWRFHDNWLTSAPASTWYGVLTYINYVYELYMPNNNLRGELTNEAINFSSLGTLYLPGNHLTGNLPSNIFLGSINGIDFSNNDFTGKIPPGLGAKPNFFDLFLDHNRITDLPDDFKGEHFVVNTVDVSYNDLSDSIGKYADFIGNSYINTVRLNNNKIYGTLPAKLFPSFGGPSILDLSHNKLNGTIPVSISKSYIRELYLSYNRLSGSIPNFTRNALISLYLDHNKFTGTIPDSLGKFHSLVNLHLEFNQLTGNLPHSLVDNPHLVELYLNNNQLSGTLPSLPGKYIKLSHNHFTGYLPNKLNDSSQVVFFDVSDNDLNGSISKCLSASPIISVINLSHNQFHDTIPASFGNPYITSLILTDNKLTGNIPSTFKNSVKLQYLRINYNLLSGSVPSFLKNLPKLKQLCILKNNYTFDGLETLVPNNKIDTFKYNAQNKIAINEDGSKLSVYAGGTLSNNTYNWYRDSALVTTINGDSTFMPSTSGVYYVTVTNKLVTGLTLYSNTISFDGSNSLMAAAVNKPSSLSIYPNPATSNAVLSFKASGNYTITVTGVSGVNQFTVKGIAGDGFVNTVSLPVNRLTAGIYLITLTDEKGTRQTARLNKQ